MRKILALIPLCLLASCIRYIPIVDPYIVRDCDNPELEGNTYRDVVTLAVKRGEALEDCTARMQALRK